MRAGALFCLAFFTTAVPAAVFPAHVLRCHDGDTCILDTGVRVRLAEIDAPEAKGRVARLGLWADPRAVASWDWRHSGAGPFRPQ